MKKAIFTLILTACTVLSASAQDKIDSTAYRAMQVGQVMQQERVYLHFDNSAYYLGETMWFKAYVSFGADNRPSKLSKVLYVELVAPEGYVVETKKYNIDDKGSCHGEFELNPLFLSGYYEVRAYTRYMLNWDSSSIFSRVFPIFDRVNADNWDFKNMLDRKRGFSHNGKWITAERPEATLDFFPEGGKLVEGTESRVAYELRGEGGLFGEEKITIYENDTPLLETTPKHMGKGTFTLTPKQNAKYRAEVTVKNSKGKAKRHKFNLPKAEKEGVVLSIAENGSHITASISSNCAENREMGFVILNRGTMGYYRKFPAGSGRSSFTFAKDSLPEGVNRAVVFTGSIPLAERQFFVMHDSLQSGDQGTVKLNVTANGYHVHNTPMKPNGKVTVKISREDGKPLTSASDLSLSVSDLAGSQKTSFTHNLYTYLLLGSELKGYIPDAAQYFDPDNKNRREHLDLLMLTHGWTSYDWQMLTRNTIEDIQPIERGITIKGKLFQKWNDRRAGKVAITPQKDILTRLDISLDKKEVSTFTLRTDSTGSFIADLGNFYGTRVASLKPMTPFKQGGNIFYNFALDRYYSPKFRLYDYWESHTGEPMSKAVSDSLIKINPFEYMLSSLEVTAKRKEQTNERPPHSEMRFNYLDEWEYAQDVTYMNVFRTYEDEIYNTVKSEAELEADKTWQTEKSNNEEDKSIENEEVISLNKSDDTTSTRYIGNIRYGNEATTIPTDHDYDHILTANDVVLSAMRRHNYSWAYWVQLMVVLGEYSHSSTPKPDMEYLHGLPNADKMTNFKEIVIRSDEKTRSQFENRSTHWMPLTRMLDNKIPIQKFYRGFLSQSYLFAPNGADGCPIASVFLNRLHNSAGTGINYPINPNYVACLIPYTEEERSQGVIPEYAATGSTMRYTSVQGYSESKQFYSPDYSTMPPPEKDFRRTLLWMPSVSIVNGEAIAEFYNTKSCNGITIDVAGREGRTIFSDDKITITRTAQDDTIKETQEQTGKASMAKQEAMPDSATLAACAYHHKKGIIYYNQKRYKDAITIFAELAQYRYAPSLYYIAICYLNGTGVSKNNSQALRFMKEAVKYGEPKAHYDLAVMIENGIGTEKDSASAHSCYASGAALDEPRALLEMSHRYRDGIHEAKDIAKSEELLKKAANLQNPQALLEYGKALMEKGENGIQYIKASAALENKDAMAAISDYEHEAGNHKEAYKYAKQLHLSGDHRGTKRMADYYYEGKCVGRDKNIARDLYREAAAAGNEDAKKALKELR